MGLTATTTNLTYARNDYIKQGRSHIFDKCADMIWYALNNNDQANSFSYSGLAVAFTGTARMAIGTSGTPLALSGGTSYFDIYTTCAATTSTHRSQYILQTQTATATASQVEALRVEIESNVKTGAWANAIMAQIDYKTSGAAHGMAATICAEMVPPNSSLSRGALYALDLEFGCGASSSWASAGPVAFIKMENWGTATHFSANAFLFHLAGETSSSGNLLYNETLRVRIGTSTRYLVMSTAEGTYTSAYPVALTNTLTVGVDGTGHDVKFFGDTASCYLLWDQSEDALVTAGVGHLHLSGIDADAGEGIGSVIQMGLTGTPLTSAEDETELVSCYFESTGKNAYGMRMQVTKTSTTAGAPRVLTLRAILGHTTGFGPQGANAVDARATLDKTGGTGISGEMHAMESQCRVEDTTRTVQGTYAAHKFTNNFQTGNTMPATTYFARFRDEGSVKTPYLFELSGVSSTTLFCTATNTVIDHALAIKIDGTDYWIGLYDATS